PFDWEKDFENDYLKNIKYYCLVMSENYIKNHYKDIIKYARVIENRLNDEDYTMECAIKENGLILELAEKHNVHYILIDDKYSVNVDLEY
ncbi:MAG: adenylate kinase, partial [Lachnospiraceae bacterium]|nr:adenylate kinase [Lachnospiraceae bacterium]